MCVCVCVLNVKEYVKNFFDPIKKMLNKFTRYGGKKTGNLGVLGAQSCYKVRTLYDIPNNMLNHNAKKRKKKKIHS